MWSYIHSVHRRTALTFRGLSECGRSMKPSVRLCSRTSCKRKVCYSSGRPRRHWVEMGLSQFGRFGLFQIT